MKNEKITNATFNTLDDIITLCNELNEGNTFDAVPDSLVTKVNTFNEGIITATACKYLATDSKDFYKSIICLKTETPFNAIACNIVKITLTDSGNLEVKDDILKALTFDDFVKTYINKLANAHADQKPTNEDRKKAHNYFYGSNGEGLLQCLIYTATNCQKLDGMSLKKSADLIKAYSIIKERYTTEGKDNPFDGDSNRKKAEQLKAVLGEFIGEFEGFTLNKYHFDAFAQLVATLNRKGIFTINNVSTAMQSLILVSRHAYNGIFFEIKDKAKILHKDK